MINKVHDGAGAYQEGAGGANNLALPVGRNILWGERASSFGNCWASGRQLVVVDYSGVNEERIWGCGNCTLSGVGEG